MSQPQDILDLARQRGLVMELGYAGAVTPTEAYTLLTQFSGPIHLVDVRTHPEWFFVGQVPQAELIEWQQYPLMEPNPDFLRQLQAKVPSSDVVLFLCRSGARSHLAAELAAANGYVQAYNILEGFEGDKDARAQRGFKNGWKAAGLPWGQ